MNRPLRPYALIALAIIVVGVLENVFFGADHGEPRHEISVWFFLSTVVAALALLALGVVAVTRRFRRSRAS